MIALSNGVDSAMPASQGDELGGSLSSNTSADRRYISIDCEDINDRDDRDCGRDIYKERSMLPEMWGEVDWILQLTSRLFIR
ncbi:MAG: hypothetical protein M1835_003560 [Candelina submexicana]|nr:MAG: hypothetical protein M1835_003560 [Candelina submexicana]